MIQTVLAASNPSTWGGKDFVLLAISLNMALLGWQGLSKYFAESRERLHASNAIESNTGLEGERLDRAWRWLERIEKWTVRLPVLGVVLGTVLIYLGWYGPWALIVLAPAVCVFSVRVIFNLWLDAEHRKSLKRMNAPLDAIDLEQFKRDIRSEIKRKYSKH